MVGQFVLTVWALIYLNGALYQQEETITFQNKVRCESNAEQVKKGLKERKEVLIFGAVCEPEEEPQPGDGDP